VFFPKEEGFISHNERSYDYVHLKDIPATAIATMPAVVDAPGGVKLAIAESDVEEYPGLWLKGTAGNGLSARSPRTRSRRRSSTTATSRSPSGPTTSP